MTVGSFSLTTGLFYHYVDLVAVVHLKRFWTIIVFDALAVEYEATLIIGEALALAVCFHELLQLSLLFYFEEYLGSILRFYFDIHLFAIGCWRWSSCCLLTCSCSFHF